MVKRSESAIVGITNLTFCHFGHDARNFVVIQTSVLEENQKPIFSLFPAIFICKYSHFICLANIFLIEGISGEKYDSRHVGTDISLLFVFTTRLQCDSFSELFHLQVAMLAGIYWFFEYLS